LWIPCLAPAARAGFFLCLGAGMGEKYSAPGQ
jgi:hypothetical protein